MKYLTRLSVYKFSRKKIKCDYSIIPIEIRDGFCYSLVSNEKIKMINEKKWFVKKEHGFKEITCIFESDDLEKDENDLRRKTIKLWKQHFFMCFKYNFFLGKKIKNKQL